MPPREFDVGLAASRKCWSHIGDNVHVLGACVHDRRCDCVACILQRRPDGRANFFILFFKSTPHITLFVDKKIRRSHWPDYTFYSNKEFHFIISLIKIEDIRIEGKKTSSLLFIHYKRLLLIYSCSWCDAGERTLIHTVCSHTTSTSPMFLFFFCFFSCFLFKISIRCNVWDGNYIIPFQNEQCSLRIIDPFAYRSLCLLQRLARLLLGATNGAIPVSCHRVF